MVENSLPISEESKPTPFELYDFFQRQCRFEQTTLWVRFGVMVASQGALIGFYIEQLGGDWPVKALMLAVAGLVFALLFREVQARTLAWIGHYIDYLDELEPEALGKYWMNRAAKKGEFNGKKFKSTRKINELTSVLVICGWLLFVILAASQFLFEIPGLTNAVT